MRKRNKTHRPHIRKDWLKTVSGNRLIVRGATRRIRRKIAGFKMADFMHINRQDNKPIKRRLF